MPRPGSPPVCQKPDSNPTKVTDPQIIHLSGDRASEALKRRATAEELKKETSKKKLVLCVSLVIFGEVVNERADDDGVPTNQTESEEEMLREVIDSDGDVDIKYKPSPMPSQIEDDQIDERIISEESVRFMLSEQVEVAYPAQFGNNIFGAGFGINLQIDNPSEVDFYRWGGAYNTGFWMDPADNSVGVLLTSHWPGRYNRGNAIEQMVDDARIVD